MYEKPTITVLGAFGNITLNGNQGGDNGGNNGGADPGGKQSFMPDGLGQIGRGAGGS
jgi:hypothetical protein